jgi:hypothetical protein
MLNKKLENATRTGDWSQINTSKLTEEMLTQLGELGGTIFHIAADHETLHKIPQKLLNQNIWLQTNDVQDTVIHLASKNNGLDLVPKNLLTEDVLNMKDIQEFSILDYICLYQPLKNIQNAFPKGALSDKTLGDTNKPWGSCLYLLTSKIINEEVLKKNKIPKTLKHDKHSLDPENLTDNIKIILSILTTNNLKKHLHLKRTSDATYNRMKKLIKTELFQREMTKKDQTPQILEI